jgi:L-cystine uptake protein TcyP (sodium:dicarboxylate symporter family)
MRNPLGFFTELMRQPMAVVIWVFVLMVVNIASVGFWSEPLARWIFITFMISAMLMMALYSRFGFEKILGLGHILWIPLVGYGFVRLPMASGPFRSYLIVLLLCNGVSLALDIVDVWKYFAPPRG